MSMRLRLSILSFTLCLAMGCGNVEPATPAHPPVQPTKRPGPPKTPPPIGGLERALRDSGLVDIQTVVPGILVDLKYSTEDNFVHLDVYGDLERCYLRPEAAEKLKKAQELLESQHPGYKFLVYDGVRPHHIQKLMWDSLEIPFKRNYLAPPWEGSVHNYGCAVDLTIVDARNRPLDMGTPFDHFGKEAQPQLEAQMVAQGKLTPEQVENRKLLRTVMKKAGFYDIHTEWWHFNAVPNSTVRRRYSRIP